MIYTGETMRKHIVSVGKVCDLTGYRREELRDVEFYGQLLAEIRIPGGSQRLYEIQDGYLVYQVQNVWRGFSPSYEEYSLKKVSKEDLSGEYAFLGREAGLAVPMSLEEALAGAWQQTQQVPPQTAQQKHLSILEKIVLRMRRTLKK